MPLKLVPLCTIRATLPSPVVVGQGPSGFRVVGEVASAIVEGDRLRGTMKGHAAADWIIVNDGIATIDVRLTVATHDGAIVLVQYQGRADMSGGIGSSPIYVAPRFETADPRYAWLNAVQAVGKGRLSPDGHEISYEWFEVR